MGKINSLLIAFYCLSSVVSVSNSKAPARTAGAEKIIKEAHDKQKIEIDEKVNIPKIAIKATKQKLTAEQFKRLKPYIQRYIQIILDTEAFRKILKTKIKKIVFRQTKTLIIAFVTLEDATKYKVIFSNDGKIIDVMYLDISLTSSIRSLYEKHINTKKIPNKQTAEDVIRIMIQAIDEYIEQNKKSKK
ncbi:MAG: hypothetical protein LBF70_00250 [Holosporales bacterium]|jgi:hypothetical protein|nr:hypothetical protein [Holosporales bacterium]